ncbi:urea transporter [Synechococcus sp. BSF8S]|uniref:urea transporter n=1 Tax=Synechococcales TaxID=1890424 RepID=UPI0016280E43|nr:MULTISPECIES: urea transporter [unclassified Synechococcus]MBC1259984.1 urea transporter [Synechococcus sp. BSF8S]MBC1262594.1 urea transporter [Synechococcus sp. BSA11S]
MPQSEGTDQAQAFDLLARFVDSPEAPAQRPWLPTAGTLPQLVALWDGHPAAVTLTCTLRSLGQVIFINNPISGLLLLLALLWQSPAMGIFSVLGIATATLTSRLIGADRGARLNGIYGFNGALVGSAAAAFAALDRPLSLVAWLLLVAAGAALTTLLVEGLGGWLVRRLGVPPLTLPFCLITWLLLSLVMAVSHPALGLMVATPATAQDPGGAGLLLGVVRGFGQVFLCPSLPSGLIVLVAVAAASPLAALLGLAGGLVSSLTALAIGMAPASVALGLGSYNGVLTAIAIGGIFYATTRGSLLIALLAAAGASLVTPALSQVLATAQLPVLTFPFVLATMATMVVMRPVLPSLLPVALHSVHTPEEHRQRFRVARSLLNDFRRRLRQAVCGEPKAVLMPGAEAAHRQQLQSLFEELDKDGNGSLSVAELATGLMQRQPSNRADAASRQRFLLIKGILKRMDLNGDGRVDHVEFAELMLRLRRLQEGRARLLTYLQPVDVDGNTELDPAELDRLLVSVGQPRLLEEERQRIFGTTGGGLSWGSFLDQLLLT